VISTSSPAATSSSRARILALASVAVTFLTTLSLYRSDSYTLARQLFLLANEGLGVPVARFAVDLDVCFDQPLHLVDVAGQVDGHAVRLACLPRGGPVHLAHVVFGIVEVQSHRVAV